MNDQQTINSSENDTVKSNRESFKEVMLIFIAILTLLFTIRFFILSEVDTQGCDGMFGALSPDCKGILYSELGMFSIPFTVLSLVGSFKKKVVPSIIGSLLFLGFNIYLLSLSPVDNLRAVVIESVIFSGTLFSIELFLELLILMKTNKK